MSRFSHRSRRELARWLGAVAFVAVSAAAARADSVSAFGDWRADSPGARFRITPADLPLPFATGSASDGPRVVAPPPGARPKVPEGFSVARLASGLPGPRVLRVAPNGDVFVAESEAGRVEVLRLTEDMSKVEARGVFADHLDAPFGVAFFPPGPDPSFVYVAMTERVVRFPYRAGDLAASGHGETIVDGLPSGGHWTRDLAVSPDGTTLYVSVGSASNVDEGAPPPPAAGLPAFEAKNGRGASEGDELGRADVLAFDPDGRHRRVVATGLRNCSGLTIQPANGRLWCVVNERDGLGDNLPPDYATAVKAGAFYGWPWFYIGGNPDPRHPHVRADLKDAVTIPDVLIQPHSAPLGIAFYEGGQFPAEYKGDAFVALHGSWNRAERTGYKVVRLLFHDGKPTGEYEDFLVGFVRDASGVWGRPVGVAVALDGSLLVSEDANGAIWRVWR
jgi:glucose/arabinose dehydrogenase